MSPAGGGEAAAASGGGRWGWLLIFAIAALAMLPEAITGPSTSDSMLFNIGWTEQFRDLFRAGDLYPRWLPRSWDGLGSPTFYFYPPLFFWTAAVADAVTLRLLPVEAIITLTSALMLVVSGLGMRAWIGAQTSNKIALLAAAAYMLAPYHIYNIYGRGALAEASAYALLPWIMLAIRRVGEGRAIHAVTLAVTYALLAMTHLPSALLASISAIPAYALFTAWTSADRPRTLALLLGGGLLGLGLAAAYLLPALSLTGHISSQALFGVFYSPESWFFWRPWAWPRGAMYLIMPIWVSALLFALLACWYGRSGPRRDEALFWVGVTLFTLVMVSGALPFLWDLPYVAQVQFPWRMFVITEFAVVTALALAAPKFRSGLGFAAALPLTVAVTVAATGVNARLQFSWKENEKTLATIRSKYQDAPEYLPSGFTLPLSEYEVPNTDLIVLPAMPQAVAAGAAVGAVPTPDGGLNVIVDGARPTTMLARRFYFPHWEVRNGAGERVAVAPATADRLLSWPAPAGRSTFIVRPGVAPYERAGLWTSIASLLLLFGAAAFIGQRHFHDSRVRRRP